MAIAPDQSEIFLREVDENLRRDRLRGAARAYGKWAIAAVVLMLAAIGAWLLWRDHQAKQAATDSEQLAATIDNIGSANLAPVPGQLDALERSRADAISVSARLTRAALALQQNDRPKATELYRQVAADGAVGQAWRDLALVRQTALEFDALQPQAVIDRLASLARPGNPWFGSAGEMTALALLKANRKAEAGRLLTSIGADAGVPESIRGRVLQLAGSLGIDTSAALARISTAPAP